VLEAGVRRAGVNKVSPSKLPDSPQALEGWLLDYLSLPVVNLDETMDWAADFVFAVRVLRQRPSPPPPLIVPLIE
jgi:hypothetical protein